MKIRMIAITACMLALAVAAGCGGGEDSSQQAAEKAGGEATKAAATPAPSDGPMDAVIKGVVKFDGAAPKAKRLKMSADPVCKSMHSEPVLSEEVVVNDNGTLQWVMVYVKSGLEGRKFDTPGEPVVLDQTGCTYEPHVFGMMTGQGLKILNSDETLHNIHPLSKVNKPFNVGMPKPGELMKNFDLAEAPFHIKCDVHKWMSSYCAVFEHPFFYVTGGDGSFALSGLPAGTYTVVAWHESFGEKEMSVTLGASETKEVEFTFVAESAS